MNIQTVLDGVTPYSEENSYFDFHKIVDKAYVEVSFWGNRNVYAVRYSGSVDLEDLLLKIRVLVDAHPEFSEEQRAVGKSIENKLEHLYEVSEDQKKKANCISRFINNYIFFALNFMQADIYHYGIDDFKCFDYCTAKQYKNLTGSSPQNSPAGAFCRRGFGEEVKIWTMPKIEEN